MVAPVALDVLGDPTRRAVLARVARGGASVQAIANELPVSRAAVSQHLRQLRDAHLVRYRTEGTRHVYELDPSGLNAVREWLDGLWQTALDAFAAEVEREMNERRGGRNGS